MIKILNDNVRLTFGTGDIGLNSGVYLGDPKGKKGFVIFYNQEPRAIGSPGDVRAGTSINVDDYPVIMHFHKTESIDVLIEVLTEAKELMLHDNILGD